MKDEIIVESGMWNVECCVRLQSLTLNSCGVATPEL